MGSARALRTRDRHALGADPARIAGLLLDQQFGLIQNAPIYLVALAGLPRLAAPPPADAELLAATAPYVVAVAGYHMWWAGRSSPARFLVPVLLPLALPLAAWWAHATSRTARAVTLVLLAASAVLTAALVLVDHGALVYNSRDGHALWLLAANPSVNLTYALPSLFQAGPAAAWRVAGAWVARGDARVVGAAARRGRRLATGPWLAACSASRCSSSPAARASGGRSRRRRRGMQAAGWSPSPRAPATLARSACEPSPLVSAVRAAC